MTNIIDTNDVLYLYDLPRDMIDEILARCMPDDRCSLVRTCKKLWNEYPMFHRPRESTNLCHLENFERNVGSLKLWNQEFIEGFNDVESVTLVQMGEQALLTFIQEIPYFRAGKLLNDSNYEPIQADSIPTSLRIAFDDETIETISFNEEVGSSRAHIMYARMTQEMIANLFIIWRESQIAIQNLRKWTFQRLHKIIFHQDIQNRVKLTGYHMIWIIDKWIEDWSYDPIEFPEREWTLDIYQDGENVLKISEKMRVIEVSDVLTTNAMCEVTYFMLSLGLKGEWHIQGESERWPRCEPMAGAVKCKTGWWIIDKDRLIL